MPADATPPINQPPWKISGPGVISDANGMEVVKVLRPKRGGAARQKRNTDHVVDCVNGTDTRTRTLVEALSTIVNSGPLNSGLRDDAAMSLARAALDLAKP